MYSLSASFHEASDAVVISHTPFSPEHATQATLQSRPTKPALHWQLDDVSLYVPRPSHSVSQLSPENPVSQAQTSFTKSYCPRSEHLCVSQSSPEYSAVVHVHTADETSLLPFPLHRGGSVIKSS